MRYLPKSPDERKRMLAEIGAKSIDDLFAIIPEEYRLTGDLNLPRQHAESEIIDYCDHYAGVVATQPGGLNPYKLGVELLRHVERRWDRGQFGLEYMHVDDPKKRAEWNTGAGLGRQKLLEVRRVHNDITFLDEFLDEDFCHQSKMFLYDYDRRNNRYVISGRDFREIKRRLLGQLTNFGQPAIEVVDGNFENRSELLLRHIHEGADLDSSQARDTLRNAAKLWTRPVSLLTKVDGKGKLLRCEDGNISERSAEYQ